MSWPAIKKSLTVAEFADYVRDFNFTPWRPSGMMLHNTGSPSLKDRPEGFLPQHLVNLEDYFKNQNGWSGAPHLFIDFNEPSISLFNPMNHPGVHSPSFNGTHLGVELLGDYSVEDDETGKGAAVVKFAVAAFGILHARLGLNPDHILFHKDDPKTTHDCPGKHLFEDKGEFIQSVKEYMGSGGDLMPVPEVTPEPKSRTGTVTNVGTGDTLNVRAGSSARERIIEHLDNGTRVGIIGEAMNGKTRWFRVTHQDVTGWASSLYIKEDK